MKVGRLAADAMRTHGAYAYIAMRIRIYNIHKIKKDNIYIQNNKNDYWCGMGRSGKDSSGKERK